MTGHTTSILLVTKKKRDHRQTRAPAEKPTSGRQATESSSGKDKEAAEKGRQSWRTGEISRHSLDWRWDDSQSGESSMTPVCQPKQPDKH